MFGFCDVDPLMAIQNNAVKMEGEGKVENPWVLVSMLLGTDLRIAIDYVHLDAQ